MKLFLTGKAWQLFVGFLAFAIIFQFLPLNLGTSIFVILYGGWLYAIASAANDRVETKLKKSNRWILLGLIYAVLYIAFSSIFLLGEKGSVGMAPFLIPLHLLAMCGIFYALIVAARRLVTYERQKEVGFYEFSGPFFLLWFFPFGIWFIQPRVNKMISECITSGCSGTAPPSAEP